MFTKVGRVVLWAVALIAAATIYFTAGFRVDSFMTYVCYCSSKFHNNDGRQFYEAIVPPFVRSKIKQVSQDSRLTFEEYRKTSEEREIDYLVIFLWPGFLVVFLVFLLFLWIAQIAIWTGIVQVIVWIWSFTIGGGLARTLGIP
ncbi:MAG: hypothetical protein AAB503_02035 [Patescibacteria group bacterium]